ncbi:sgc region protein SgcQ [Microbispora rosea subsp. aerata]|nr:BtpA/SgcQ family protein [Microbispora rosea]GGO28137.1 sgc region protein SgcQ [Microbispora rosea subsp. aerata]GIH56190.1 sgc region protein SgcQ [Microbispora rosea subsp. aerata]GLJ85755.1 sgc region protein SgcQ [Microbispora rosea subsp. aerata]
MRNLEAFGRHKVILGMIHLQPLPGTPFHREGSFEQILDNAVASARALDEGGADGCLIQTVDRVYSTGEQSDPARIAAMSVITRAVAQATRPDFHIGVQLMRNAVQASLAVAKVAGGSFVRAGALVGATLTTHGMVEADPLAVMEYRKKIDAWDVGVIAEVESMHFTWFGGGKTVGQVAKAARQVGADAVSLCHEDEAVALEMIAAVRAATPDLPIVLAGHTNHDNAARLLSAADGAFVGTCLERGGWGGLIDVEKVKAYVEIVRGLQP